MNDEVHPGNATREQPEREMYPLDPTELRLLADLKRVDVLMRLDASLPPSMGSVTQILSQPGVLASVRVLPQSEVRDFLLWAAESAGIEG
jgi:hypothetical protein